MALLLGGDLDQSLSVVRTGAEHAADEAVRGNLLYLHVLAYLGGVALPEHETIEAIGLIKASSMPTIRAGGSWVHANLLADSDALTAIALYQDAIEGASSSRIMEETCRSMQLDLIARTDHIDAALDGFTHAVDAWQASMGDVYTGRGMGVLAAWLARLGYHNGAAQLFGATTRGRRETPLLSPEALALPEVMGSAAYDAAFDAGGALNPMSRANLARQLIAQVRTDHADA